MDKNFISEEDLRKYEKKYCSYGDTVHYVRRPPIITKQDGSFVWIGKKKFLDWQMLYSAANFGYRNPKILNPVLNKLRRLPQVTPQFLEEDKIILAKYLAESASQTFGDNWRVHFDVGGSAAVETAIKIARINTGKQLALSFYGSYHGRTLGATAVSSGSRYRLKFGSFGDRAVFIPYPTENCFYCQSGYKHEGTCAEYNTSLFRKMFEDSQYFSMAHGNISEVGYLLVEPIQGTGGYAKPAKGYFKNIQKICKKFGILIIADEIQMGFYRTGCMWSSQLFDLEPDIIVCAKSLTNGMAPTSAIIAKSHLVNPEKWGPGSTHSTFSSYSLGMSAGRAVMEFIRQNSKDLERQAGEIGYLLSKGIKAIKSPLLGEVDYTGAAIKVEIIDRKGNPSKEITDKIIEVGIEGDNIKTINGISGLILDQGGWYKSTLTIAPNLFSTKEEISIGITLFNQILLNVENKQK